MPRSSLLLVLFLLSSLPLLTAQETFAGTVTDAATGRGIPFATVYLDGTTTGDLTAEDGTFSLTVLTARRPLTVTVSHLNYVNQTLTVEDLTTPLAVSLQPQGNELTRIEVADVNQRANNLREFRRRMVGNDDWGAAATLLNDSVLIFERDPAERQRGAPGLVVNGTLKRTLNSKNLKARSRDALQFELPDLGYRLRLDLVGWEIDYASGRMKYLGTSFYQPIEPANERQRRRTEKNRIKAYYGSQMHFNRSLLADSLSTNGYRVMELVNANGLSRNPQTNPIDLTSFLRRLPDGSYLLEGLEGRTLAILFYANNKHYPQPPWRQNTNPLQSRLTLIGPARIYPDGTSADVNMVFSGDMASRSLAWWLPSDYQPPRR